MSLANQGKGNRNKPTFNNAGKPNNPAVEETKDEVKVNTVDDILSSVVNVPKVKPREQISIYVDYDVKVAFEKFGRKHGKGSKSDLINNFLKQALKDYIKNQ